MLRTALPCTCGICGRLVIDARTAHIDHIVPLSKGGTDRLLNLRVTHAACNMSRGDRPLPPPLPVPVPVPSYVTRTSRVW
jgi:5-methylcytosine-specific restriction endonuclease McrA